jgi:hypothetical protein
MVFPDRENQSAEARAIVHAVRAIHMNPECLAEVQSDLPAALDRMGLAGIARHAVAATLALSVSGVLAVPGTPFFWAS